MGAAESWAEAGALPAELTPFVGRRDETDAVRHLLSASRLVTVTGVGGVGMTRLAYQVGAGLRRAFPDGVRLVELASLRDPGLLPETVAAAVGLRGRRTRLTLDSVAAHVRKRHMLLVVDNCEHLADACVPVLDALLRAAPRLRVLATSRHVLGITGEQTFFLEPMPGPRWGRATAPGTGAGPVPQPAPHPAQDAAAGPPPARRAPWAPGRRRLPDRTPRHPRQRARPRSPTGHGAASRTGRDRAPEAVRGEAAGAARGEAPRTVRRDAPSAGRGAGSAPGRDSTGPARAGARTPRGGAAPAPGRRRGRRGGAGRRPSAAPGHDGPAPTRHAADSGPAPTLHSADSGPAPTGCGEASGPPQTRHEARPERAATAPAQPATAAAQRLRDRSGEPPPAAPDSGPWPHPFGGGAATAPPPLSAKEALRYESVVLFAQRAAAVLPGFRVSDGNAAAVADLVHRLDGLPLALELAAARMRTLTLREIIERLDDRFALLTGGSRAALPRQRALRELMDWSHDLCSDRERVLWARASVFAGGFGLEAAEEVCAGPGLPRPAVVDAVHGLVEKSVLVRHEQHGRARFRMLETVRAYGQERLAETAETVRLRRNHRDHCLELARRAEGAWFGPEQVAWFARLHGEHANLRAALDFCLRTPGEAAAGLALASLPRHYWISQGGLGEGRRWLARLLEAGPGRGAAHVTAMGAYLYLGLMQGAVVESVPAIDAYEAEAERIGDASGLAWALHHRALAAAFRGDLAVAAGLLGEAAARHRGGGDLAGAMECTFKHAIVLTMLGHTDRALALCRECRTVTSAHGETWIRADALFAESLIRWETGDRGAAALLARQAIRLLRPLGDLWGIALCVEILAWSAASDGGTRRAACLLGVLRSLWEAIGGALFAAPFMAVSHERCERETRAALPAADFERMLRHGAGLGFDEALAYVLEEPSARLPDAARDTPPRTPGHTARATAAAPAPRTGGRTAGSAGPYSGTELTRREREVADLVAAGLGNQEIAARLVIARRTAESHVGRALAKLGLTSRTQLAAWVHERRAAGALPARERVAAPRVPVHTGEETVPVQPAPAGRPPCPRCAALPPRRIPDRPTGRRPRVSGPRPGRRARRRGGAQEARVRAGHGRRHRQPRTKESAA
ncbi:LuxR C-terminal-related transcriptional regulator [Streptomyces sp. CC228A]|uniref:LuxR C-terminal-related transcriptional regulator n=1 Tax=Streptomyces sp. CC228A TaxID=2898186 RepID=UPI0035A9288C